VKEAAHQRSTTARETKQHYGRRERRGRSKGSHTVCEREERRETERREIEREGRKEQVGNSFVHTRKFF